MIKNTITVTTADGPMTAFVWRPDGGGPFPVVVCYHAGPGLGEDIDEVAKRFAHEGYYAVVPDLYHRFGKCLTFDIKKEFERVFEVAFGTTDRMMVDDTAALADAVRRDPAASDGPVGVIGFCRTAGPVLVAMAEHPDLFPVGAMLHPANAVNDTPDSAHLFAQRVPGEVYAGFGLADVVAPFDQQAPLIEELRTLGDRATIEVHERAGHGFLHKSSPGYDEVAAGSAWRETLRIFGSKLTPKAQTGTGA